jgi:diacylglycerol kinase
MKEFKKFCMSFAYAGDGLWHTVIHERNMRAHFAVMAHMYVFLLCFNFFTVSRLELAVIFLANAAVLTAELFNTAVERAMDAAIGEYNKMVKHAKDVAAAAVLVAAVFSVGIGLAILYQPAAFQKMAVYYRAYPGMLVLFLAGLALSAAYVFAFPKFVHWLKRKK